MAKTTESTLKAVLSRYQKGNIEKKYLEQPNIKNEYDKKTDKEKIELLKSFAKKNNLKLSRNTSQTDNTNQKNYTKKTITLIDAIYTNIQKDKTITYKDIELVIQKLNTLIQNIENIKNNAIKVEKDKIKQKIREYNDELNRLNQICPQE